MPMDNMNTTTHPSPRSPDAPVASQISVSRETLGWAFTLAAATALFFIVFLTLLNWPTAQNMRTADSRYAAMTWLEGKGFLTTRGEAFAKTPPIYPILLGLLHQRGIKWWTAVSAINAFCFAIGVCAVHGLGCLLGLRTTRYLVLAYVVFGPSWFLVREARPDIIFLVCGLMAVWLGALYWQRRSLAVLLGLAAVCGIAAVSRYMALFALFPVAAACVALARQGSMARKVLHLAIFALVACAPIVPWLYYTHARTGYWSGMDRFRDRKPADERLTTLTNNLNFMGRTLAIDLFAPEDFGQLNALKGEKQIEHGRLVLGVMALFGAFAAAIALLRREQIGRRARIMLAPGSGARAVLVVAGGYFVVHQTLMILLWTTGNNDPIDCRFVAPTTFLVVPVAAAVLALLWRSSRTIPVRAALTLAAAAFVGLHAWKVYATWEVVPNIAASPWAEDIDQFAEAMSKTNVEERIEERLKAKGRPGAIPDKKRERLEDKGKVVERDPQKVERARNMALLLDEDGLAKPSVTAASKTTARKDASAAKTSQERKLRRQAEAGGEDEPRPSEAIASRTSTEDLAAPDRAPTGQPLRPLEFVRFDPPADWNPFVPSDAPTELRAAFHISEPEKGRNPAMVLVLQLAPDADPQADPLRPWLAGFASTDGSGYPEPVETTLTINELPTRLVEVSGDYESADPDQPTGHCSMVAAVIDHPLAPVVVVATGQRKIMVEREEQIVGFLMSVTSLTPLEPRLAQKPPQPVVEPAPTPESAPPPVAPAEHDSHGNGHETDVPDTQPQAQDPAEASSLPPVEETADESSQEDLSGSADSVTFTFEPAWAVYAPKSAGENFHAGYFLDPVDRSRTSAKLVVTFLPTQRDDPETIVDRWLRDFTRVDMQRVRSSDPPSRRRPGWPVTLAEFAGTYSPPTWAIPVEDYALIGAVIVHPEGVFLVKAAGPRPLIVEQRPMILAFIGSARCARGAAPLMPPEEKPAPIPKDDPATGSARRTSAAETGDAEPSDDPGQETQPPAIPPLEHIVFLSEVEWPPFVPAEPNPNFRLGYTLAVDRDDKPIAKLMIGQAEGSCGTHDENVEKWLKGFSPANGREEVEVTEEELVVDGLPVQIVEVYGTFQPDSGKEPQRDHALLAAQIVHPDATYHLRAMGPARIILRERQAILDFIASVHRTDVAEEP